MVHAFWYGVILALGLIIPLGVQNIFVFNQGAHHRHFFSALPSVLTASLCDTILIVVSILGLSLVVLSLSWLKNIILLTGLSFLIYMGWITWKNKSSNLLEKGECYPPKKQIIFATSVSLLNPHALLDTVSVIGTNSLNFAGKERLVYTLACILISWIWFFSLSLAGYFIHSLDKSGFVIKFINQLSAVIIWGVAFYIAIQLLLAIFL